MTIFRLSLLSAVIIIGTALIGPLRAQYDPIFDFIPLGGRSLLAEIFDSKPPADEMRAIVTAKRTSEEWGEYLKSRKSALPGLQDLDEQQLLTLASYLSFNMPLPADKVPADLAKANWAKLLPMDGRDTALNYCQSCHIITVVMTQDRPKEHWLGTLNKPSHIEIALTPEQREALAIYLVLNAGLPIDQIPESLRAGGATY
jgi:hypothetical protein